MYIYLDMLIYYFMCMSFLPVCIYVCDLHAWCWWRSERALDPLGLEF